jgi:hypothetical protein
MSKGSFDKLLHDESVAGLYQAMALRFYCRYVQMRNAAKSRGGDLTDYGPLPTERDAFERYEAAVEEWLGEPPDSADAAEALVIFAGILAADRLVGEVTRDYVNDERDAYHQCRALALVSSWTGKRSIDEAVAWERQQRAEAQS